MGKEWAGLFFPRGKNGPAHSFPGEKTDWGEIPACYTGIQISHSTNFVDVQQFRRQIGKQGVGFQINMLLHTHLFIYP